MMAALTRDGGKYVNFEEDVFLTQFEAETDKYGSGRAPPVSISSRPTRSRIPSVKEVGERSEGPNWTMSSPAQNLAAALNDPANREYDLFTRTWGNYFVPNAPLPPSGLPDIQLGDFLRYLKETAAVSSTIVTPQYLMCVCWGGGGL